MGLGARPRRDVTRADVVGAEGAQRHAEPAATADAHAPHQRRRRAAVRRLSRERRGVGLLSRPPSRLPLHSRRRAADEHVVDVAHRGARAAVDVAHEAGGLGDHRPRGGRAGASGLGGADALA